MTEQARAMAVALRTTPVLVLYPLLQRVRGQGARLRRTANGVELYGS